MADPGYVQRLLDIARVYHVDAQLSVWCDLWVADRLTDMEVIQAIEALGLVTDGRAALRAWKATRKHLAWRWPSDRSHFRTVVNAEQLDEIHSALVDEADDRLSHLRMACEEVGMDKIATTLAEVEKAIAVATKVVRRLGWVAEGNDGAQFDREWEDGR